MARAVPIPVKNSTGHNIGTLSTGPADLALDSWIVTPPRSARFRWQRVIKETGSYLVHYYSATREQSSGDASNSENVTNREETVGDILFLELDDGVVVDCDDEDVVAVLQEIELLL